MRKLVLTTLLLVLVGAVAAAWLSSSTPSGSAIGDVNLAEDRIPGTGTIGFGVPPRQNPTAPARSAFTAGGTARAASPESSLSVPDMTIASSGLQAPAYGAPTTFRESLARNASGSSARTNRQNRSASGSRGFSSLGIGGGGVGGGGGGATVAPRDPAPARERAAVTERAAAPAAAPAPPQRPSPPSSGGGNGSGSPSSGGGGSAAPPAAPAPAAPPVVAVVPPPAVAPIVAAPEPAPAGPPPVVGVVPPFSPGVSPSASPTPEPTTMLLLGTGIAGLYRMRRYLE
jgi:hypothetical protein